MLGDGLTYLSNDKDWAKKLLIGGGLLMVSGIVTFISGIAIAFIIGFIIFPIALLIAFPVGGYYIRVMRSTVRGKNEPPEFDDWGELLKDGALSFIISGIYLFIPAVTAFVGAVVFFFALPTSGGTTGTSPGMTQPGTVQPVPGQTTPQTSEILAALGAAGIIFLIAFVLWVILSYFLIIGLVNFANEERFGAAFSLSTLREVGFSSEYVIAWLLGFVLLGTVAYLTHTIVGGVFSIIPIIGPIISLFFVGFIMPFITFYITVSSNRIFANAFTEVKGTEAGESAINGETKF
ncbi:MAG: DUF4013 domain-containing protein [Halobacteria archaeon]|nr:DUF4013 domain-containing protein [Halobacteria archaeon]